MESVIIGKVPGYNNNISGNSINYEERLKANLTVVEFQPIGYKLNHDVLLSAISREKTNSGALYNLNGYFKQNGSSTTADALSLWQELQSSHFQGVSSKQPKTFKIICTNDSTVNETLSNEFRDNALYSMPQKYVSSILPRFVGKAAESIKDFKQGIASLDSSAMQDLLKKSGDSAGLFKTLGAHALGIQTSIPQIWDRSDYNNTSSFTIKLVSPSGDPRAIEKYITEPLLRLVLACSPITRDGILYGFPPLWKVKAKGLVRQNLAGISAMTITRGGQDTVFNRFNQPTNVDVRITVQPIVKGFAAAMSNSLYTGLDGTQPKMIVSNPMQIQSSFAKTTGNIETLDSLVLYN